MGIAGADAQHAGHAGHGHAGARFAALTNYRAPSEKRIDARGELRVPFLRGDQSADEYLHALAGDHGAYNGFNLLASDLHDLAVQQPFAVAPARSGSPGLYGLSNALLDTPWPKVRSRVGALCEGAGSG